MRDFFIWSALLVVATVVCSNHLTSVHIEASLKTGRNNCVAYGLNISIIPLFLASAAASTTRLTTSTPSGKYYNLSISSSSLQAQGKINAKECGILRIAGYIFALNQMRTSLDVDLDNANELMPQTLAGSNLFFLPAPSARVPAMLQYEVELTIFEELFKEITLTLSVNISQAHGVGRGIRVNEGGVELVSIEYRDDKFALSPVDFRTEQCQYERTSRLETGQWVATVDAIEPESYFGRNTMWRWKPFNCKLPHDLSSFDSTSFARVVIANALTDISFIGTSRTRTEYYDLLAFFGLKTDEIGAKKEHRYLQHNVTLFDNSTLKLHFFWLHCHYNNRREMPDLYTPVITQLNASLTSSGFCESSGSSSRRYAFVVTTGMCEADRVEETAFYRGVYDLVKFIASSCFTGERNKNNIFIYKLEESTNYRYTYFNTIRSYASYMVQQVMPRLYAEFPTSKISLVDAYSSTRAFTTNTDWIHYYSEEPLGTYFGNICSKTSMKKVLAAIWQSLAY